MCSFVVILNLSLHCIFALSTEGTSTDILHFKRQTTVKWPTLKFECFTKVFGRKSACIANKVTDLTIPFPHELAKSDS